MQTPSPLYTHKHQRSDPQYPFKLAVKKHKAAHIPAPQQPAILLDRQALRALKQECTQSAQNSRACQQDRRPATRLAVAEWKRSHRPLQPAHTYLENCGPQQYKALQGFAKHGGPDLRELRGCQRAAHHLSYNPMDLSQVSSGGRSPSDHSSRTRTTTDGGSGKGLSPYDPQFQQVLVDFHVYPPHYRFLDDTVAPKPGNWEYIKERLAQPHPSLSPSNFSEKEHNEFVERDAVASEEGHVKIRVIPILEGKIQDHRTVRGDEPFDNLAPLIANENLANIANLAPSKPDYFRGARPELLELRVRDELGGLVIPSSHLDLPVVPTHFTATKGPNDSIAVATRQATYDAYFGARAIHALQNYGQPEPHFDGNAYTFSCIYHGGQLKIYTSHPTQPTRPGGQPGYHMKLLRSFAMDDSPETWREGATWYRNSIDLAKEMRDEALDRANRVASQAPVSGAI